MVLKVFGQPVSKQMNASSEQVSRNLNSDPQKKLRHVNPLSSAPAFLKPSLRAMVSIGLGISLLAFPASLAMAQALPPGDGGGGGDPGGNTQPPEPIIDWQKKQDQSGRLSALTVGLLGDKIDPHTGGISFEHTDVSLPGNSSLDVSIRRRITSGGLYKPTVKAEFGDWELIAPRITVMTSSLSNYRTGNRCSTNNPLQTIDVPYPEPRTMPGGGVTTVMKNKPTFSSEYSNGYSIDVPGYGKQAMLKSSGPTAIYGSTTFATTSGWKIDCLNNITGGGQGYEATAPNGTVYRFDRFYELDAPRLNFLGHTSTAFDRYISIVAATQATDVHGNTVTYTYDGSNRLTRIEGNDGRLITLAYTNGTNMVSRVSANGRHWDYSYGTNTLTNVYDQFSYPVGAYPTLTSVTQPDGKAWSFSLQAMSAETPPALSCFPNTYLMSVTHPYGTKGDFTLWPQKHKVTGTTQSPKPHMVPPGYCPHPEPNGYASGGGQTPISLYYAPVWIMSTSSKVLSAPDLPTMTWSYSYELDQSLWGPNNDQLNRTDVTQPDGTIQRYFHGWGTEYVTGNQLVKQQTVANNVVLRETNNTHIWESNFGWDGLSGGSLDFFAERPRRVTQSVTTQDGDTFTSKTGYNINRASTSYSFGKPIRTEIYSNVSTTPRVFHQTFEYNTANWILHLPKTLTLHDRQLYEYFYNSDGQKTSQSRYGQTNYYVFTYNANGTPLTATNALGQVTRAANWKRGSAQDIWQAYGSPDQIHLQQYIDNNGWLTRQDDAMGNAHFYSYDTMGRLILLNPPGSVSNTAFTYSFPGAGGAVQTTTRGNAKSTVTYDSLLRPKLETSEDLTSGLYWVSRTNSEYDVMGRMVFKSQPSANANETKGTDYTFDALGRPLTIAENVSGGGTTTHSYHSGHRHRVTDSSGAWTDHFARGYGGPGGKDYLQINEDDDRITAINKNTYGQITSVAQSGSLGGYSVSQTQSFYYDPSTQRLCRYSGEEGGDTLYAYDLAGKMIQYAKGMGAGSSCTSPSGASLVTLGYDDLGRLETTNFADAGTPDITRSYDDNGNVLAVNRGTGGTAVNWAYGYDDRNKLTSGSLSVDSEVFNLAYAYNTHEQMTQRTLPSGQIINYTPDGLGRSRTIKQGTATLMSGASFNSSGLLTGYSLGNGQMHSQTYNDRLLPLRTVSTKSGVGTAIDFRYTYDTRGKIASAQDYANRSNDRTFSYDDLGQLTSASASLWGTASYGYDSLGNIRTRSLSNLGGSARNITLSYDSKNRVSVSADSGATGTRTVGHDGRGNVTTLGAMSFIYDMSDQPTVVSGTATGTGAANGNYRYDGNLKRVRSQVNGKVIYNVFDASGGLVTVKEVLAGPDKVTDYVSGPAGSLARLIDGVPTYLHTDHLGSPRATTSTTGGVSGWANYTPFGLYSQENLPEDQGGFTGHLKDSATGLNYMQARYYDPVMARFLSVDPVGFVSGSNTGMFNRYNYTLGDPVNLVDPSGEACVAANSRSPYCARARTYSKYDQAVKSQTRFFSAASSTVEFLANADIPLATEMIGISTSKSLLDSISSKLESANASTFQSIVTGELGGGNLDAAMVSYEQGLVQEALDAYAGNDPAGYDEVITEINSLLNAGGVLRAMSSIIESDRRYTAILDGVRADLGRNIDFSNQSDREAIGNALIKEVRSSGGCSETGSRIKRC